MSSTLGGNISFNIDDSKIEVISRAKRLRNVAVACLSTLATVSATENFDTLRDIKVSELSEAIAWLKEMEV